MGGRRTILHRALADRPAGFWFVLFLFVNLAFDLGGGAGPGSRFATLAAMAEDHSFRINPYVEWSTEWARTPDGGYYSNKAPGPMLIGFPLYWAADKVVTWKATTRAERDKARRTARFTLLKVLSYLIQVLPFFWLTAAFVVWLRRENCSPGARHLAVLLMLFGNTGSLFLNGFHGHGLAAVFLLAMAYAWVRRSPLLVGLAFGGAVLSDYGAALLLLPLLWVLRQERHRLSWGDFSLVAIGGFLPLVGWMIYHGASFGGPFTLPWKFQNPALGAASSGPFGILNWWPRPGALVELVFGGSRGLVWTNPWIVPLALSMFFLWRRHTPWADANSATRVSLGNLAFGGLFLSWISAAALNAWHGGQTVGPRFFAAVLPLFGPVLALAYDRMTPGLRLGAWVGVLAAVVLNAFVFLSNAVPQAGVALWPYYFQTLFFGPSLTALLRAGSLLLVGAVAFALFVRYWRKVSFGSDL
jgi:hypothetical protein